MKKHSKKFFVNCMGKLVERPLEERIAAQFDSIIMAVTVALFAIAILSKLG